MSAVGTNGILDDLAPVDVDLDQTRDALVVMIGLTLAAQLRKQKLDRIALAEDLEDLASKMAEAMNARYPGTQST